MTCIIGVKHEGKVYIGGDSAITYSSYDTATFHQPKVFRVGKMLVGACGSIRMKQLLQYMHPPKRNRKMDDFEYMVTRVVPMIRSVFTSGGYNKKELGRDEGGQFLIGYRGHLYRIESDYQVMERTGMYDAVGCGAPFALGTLYVTKNDTPHEMIIEALDTASHYSAAVAPPFNIVNI